ncbi:TetR/AcrR family transcriptional regulator [Acinetobacter sp. ANC 3882]|uniref:TetR/AcrR family transcriptional regulator n=1 Tax=Acinetobacter sp. ANC 3882 TaxID=2923423 RepID=UPI001F4AD80A|nr:TetR/AcrR family transcriptional regulator [Acinetobacter sp. ANC 3882]MCH7314282.1 TetR/AcrR family transcriptional regulator [Acinetobacter sp. ANC 3882]
MRPKEFDLDVVTDAAMQVFWLKGYAGTSIQDLVDGTGLSRSSLYGTFESKYNLYQKTLDRYDAVTTANIHCLEQEESAKAAIKSLLMKIAEDELADPLHRGCLIANASLELAGQDTLIAEKVTLNLQRFQKAILNVFQKAQQQGEISKEINAEALSFFVVNTIQGMRVVAKGTPTHQRRQCLLDIIDIALRIL